MNKMIPACSSSTRLVTRTFRKVLKNLTKQTNKIQILRKFIESGGFFSRVTSQYPLLQLAILRASKARQYP